MLRSMTAFGRGEAQAGGHRLSVEIRCVNHRFSDIVVRGPRKLSSLEDRVRKFLQTRFSRGRIEVVISFDDHQEKVERLTVDLELAKTYHRLLATLQAELGLEGRVSLETLVGFRDIFVLPEEEDDLERVWQVLEAALQEAAAECLRMRVEEGAAIAADFRLRLARVEKYVEEIGRRAPLVVEEGRQRLHERIKEILGQVEIDEARLAQEVAFMAERADISEEIVRLQSHLHQFGDAVELDGPQGRQLEFILQEMHREVNTIGAKANDVTIAQLVIQIKTELERLREQVQNVE